MAFSTVSLAIRELRLWPINLNSGSESLEPMLQLNSDSGPCWKMNPKTLSPLLAILEVMESTLYL